MIDPTRLAAIKALKPTPGPYLRDGCTVYILGELPHCWRNGKPIEANRIYFHVSATRDLTPDGEAEQTAQFLQSAADPEYGLQALAAEVERLQEREKPVKVSLQDTSLSSFCPFPCGVPLYPKWQYCPNCGLRLEWK